MKYIIFCAYIVFVVASADTFTYDRHQENSKVNVQADFDNIMILFGSLDDKTVKPPQQTVSQDIASILPASPFEWLLTKTGLALPYQKKDLKKTIQDSSNEIEDRESQINLEKAST